MALKVEIEADLKKAMLSGAKDTINALKGLKSAILDTEVALGVRDKGLSDEEIEKIVAKEIKKRRESAEIYRANGRVELAENEETEVGAMEKYLPKQLSEDELVTIITDTIGSVDNCSIKDMGKVIGLVKARVGNSADGALVAKLVKDNLQ